MATLYEGYTLCRFEKSPQNKTFNSGIHGIELEGDTDHVVVTDSARSVTLYKVSDQKPLGSWAVKQGQILSCPAVYNTGTKEYVTVSDSKVIRIWKAEDLLLDKAFKATLSSNVWRVHCIPGGGEAAVLFAQGAVRLLDTLLTAPQQPIEEVLGQQETIRWSASVAAETQHVVIFSTEQKGSHFLYVQSLKSNSRQKFHLEPEDGGLAPLSFSACYRKHGIISLLYLYPNGRVYQSAVSVHRPPAVEEAGLVVPLPRTQLLCLTVGANLLKAASALFLDEDHIAVVGAPHPTAPGTGTNFLCIWNTNFQTLQAVKEMSGQLYGQLWCYAGRLFIPNGCSLTVIPYECPKSSLASALGKLKNAGAEDTTVPACVPSWNSIFDGETPPPPAPKKRSRSTPSASEVQKEVEAPLSPAIPAREQQQPSLGQLSCSLVSRSVADPTFYDPDTLAAMVRTRCLCHSMCPELLPLALEMRDYPLAQLCLQSFQDVPESVTCCCLKTFLSAPDDHVETTSRKPGGLSSNVGIPASQERDTKLNGFNPAGEPGDHDHPEETPSRPVHTCPVGPRKAALLDEILQTAHTDAYLLPHLKDLSPQQVMLFLQYMQFLYVKLSTQECIEQKDTSRAPTLTQVMDWVCLLLDAHFTVLVMTPEARGLLVNLHHFVKSQVKLFSELGKLEGSLQEIHNMREEKQIGQYSIQVIQLF
ncbi:hypothetical protein NHX12_017671 [Muraenolepis orangiensis]|uniref:Nucleolar protein 11 n=1 Tax=Muraenolepis orangiensis TaxID=630683 RepID=A0A9Q0IWW7_9TELE|nr:hypothetical protein NHX12_017671 [Muraenolepis orangiensis]